MELNREQIIKAFECISRTGDVLCEGCDYRKYDGLACHRIGAKNALALIKELTEENDKLHASCTKLTRKCASLSEENERLRAENERLQKALNTDISIVRVSRGSGKTAHLRVVERIRADAIKIVAVREVRDRLTTFFADDDTLNHIEVDAEYINSQIDKITKEMEKKYV